MTSTVKIDFVSGNFVGAGEDACYEILQQLTGIKGQDRRWYPDEGIYRQIPVQWILSASEFKMLNEIHKKGSIDIMIVTKSKKIAIRVHGKKGDLKMFREGVQANNISKYCKVLDFHKRDFKEMFKDRINQKSIKEVKDMLHAYKMDNIVSES